MLVDEVTQNVMHSVALFALHCRQAHGALHEGPLAWDTLSCLLDAAAVQCWGHWMPLSLVQRLQGAADGALLGTVELASTMPSTRPPPRPKRARLPANPPRCPPPAHPPHAAQRNDAPPVLTLRVLCDMWHCLDAVPPSITRAELHNARLLHQVGAKSFTEVTHPVCTKVDNRWLAVLYGTTVALVDQHGADERVRLEHLTATYADNVLCMLLTSTRVGC